LSNAEITALTAEEAIREQPEWLQAFWRAQAMIAALCSGERDWMMSIPVRPDHDPDCIIDDALMKMRAEIERLSPPSTPNPIRPITPQEGS
jgi:hypothetical protein